MQRLCKNVFRRHTSAPVTWLDKRQVPKIHRCQYLYVWVEAPVQSWSLSFIRWVTTHRLNTWLSKQGLPRTLPVCFWHTTSNSVPRGLCTSYLVCVHQSGVWEVERGDEQSDTLTLHPFAIQVICDDPGHKVLAGAGPAVEGEGQRLVGLWVVDKTLDGFQNHRLNQVLPVKLCLKVPCQTCKEESACLKMAKYL